MTQFNKRVYDCFICGEIKEHDEDIPESSFKHVSWLDHSMKNRKFCCPECDGRLRGINDERQS
jgi:uncharacterized protein with PIN domain